ncbi:MAG: hypothetical protein KAR20_20735 [Candidatus Heimdallarchaeota archaeon]|nr:hypothetical protein [Candidatus Heimdallarchaeota archaeon]
MGTTPTRNKLHLLEQIIEDEIESMLSGDDSSDDEPLYHVTYANRLESISNAGLSPGNKRSIGSSAYDSNSSKGTFLSEEDGVSFWFNKSEEFAEHNSDNPLEDGMVPVVLRVDFGGIEDEEGLGEDEPGSVDSRSAAYIIQKSIQPEYIDVWSGTEWIPVDEYMSIDLESAFDIDGDDVYFNGNNPLKPF